MQSWTRPSPHSRLAHPAAAADHRCGYRALTHHLLGLPLGVAYFAWLVTGLAAGLGLAITLLGIPILTLVFATVRPLLAGERAMSNALLGTDIAPSALAPGGEGWINRLKAYWTDSATWRGIAYLLARFPVGIATFRSPSPPTARRCTCWPHR